MDREHPALAGHQDAGLRLYYALGCLKRQGLTHSELSFAKDTLTKVFFLIHVRYVYMYMYNNGKSGSSVLEHVHVHARAGGRVPPLLCSRTNQTRTSCVMSPVSIFSTSISVALVSWIACTLCMVC